MSDARLVVLALAAAVLFAMLTACASSASVPPCNAIIFLFGAADLTLDCPAHITRVPVFERGDK